MNLLTEGRLALIRRLQRITAANGYRTEAGGNVQSGWFNEVIQAAQQAYPMIVVQRAKGEAPEARPAAILTLPGYAVIGAVDAGLDGYDAALDDLELDLLQALLPAHGRLLPWLPRGVTTLTVGPPEHFPPGDGLAVASVMIPIHLHTVIQGN